MSSVTLFGLLPLLSLLVPFIIILLIVIFVVKTVKRFEQRADEKLTLERENNRLLQSKVNDLEERLVVIEKMLKEVE
jgi:large-conductance mechanosensitive channel